MTKDTILFLITLPIVTGIVMIITLGLLNDLIDYYLLYMKWLFQ